LIRDEAFPRSIYFSLNALNDFLTHLPKSDAVKERLAVYLNEIPNELAKEDIDKVQPEMDQLQVILGQLNKQITNTWFQPDYSVK
jgi:uncharacterized alpha-E superfamily protein